MLSKVSDKYQVVVPKEIRKSLNLSKGQKLRWVYLSQDQAIVEPVKLKTSHADSLRGLGKEIWAGVDVNKYIDNLRDDWTEWEKDHGII